MMEPIQTNAATCRSVYKIGARLAVLVSVCVLSLIVLSGQPAFTSTSGIQTAPQRPPCATSPDSVQTMFVPLGHARYFGEGQVMLNNRGVVSTTVQPTWYLEGRTAIDLLPES